MKHLETAFRIFSLRSHQGWGKPSTAPWSKVLTKTGEKKAYSIAWYRFGFVRLGRLTSWQGHFSIEFGASTHSEFRRRINSYILIYASCNVNAHIVYKDIKVIPDWSGEHQQTHLLVPILSSNQIPKCCKQLRLVKPNPMAHLEKSSVALQNWQKPPQFFQGPFTRH